MSDIRMPATPEEYDVGSKVGNSLLVGQEGVGELDYSVSGLAQCSEGLILSTNEGLRGAWGNRLGEVNILTEPMDMGVRLLKQVTNVSVSCSNIEDLVIQIYARDNNTSLFYIVEETYNMAGCNIAGVEFKIGLSGTTTRRAMLYSIDVMWKLMDRRGIHGNTSSST